MSILNSSMYVLEVRGWSEVLRELGKPSARKDQYEAWSMRSSYGYLWGAAGAYKKKKTGERGMEGRKWGKKEEIGKEGWREWEGIFSHPSYQSSPWKLKNS